MKEVAIRDEFITLGQFLKLADCISTGGHAKFFLQENEVLINGEADNRRGRKLYAGDRVEVEGCGVFSVVTRA
ncbi:S4 domain-containing protein YaaA [Paenibacillus sp. NPDC058071]|uniref:S4 domain-containing protein YaaA n=1 Tax=Paenibacillus sp. NPDC058071 TaxID=3346326 RepID=UPI0036D99D2C